MGQDSDWFQSEAFEAKVTQIRSLTAALPAEALTPLAEEVIARLAAHVTAASSAPSAERIDAFCRALLSEDDQEGARFVLDLRDHGASVETVCLGYLAAGARRLGAWWNSDDVTFMEVTLGVGRIYAILRGLRPIRPETTVLDRRRALFASTPGETHTLGVRMAADLFGSRGWDIELKLGMPHADLVDAVASSDAWIVGISAGGAHASAALARLIVAIRIVRPDAHVLVSGPIVLEAPALLAAIDADDVAADYDAALAAVDRIWRDRSRSAALNA